MLILGQGRLSTQLGRSIFSAGVIHFVKVSTDRGELRDSGEHPGAVD
jgi:hypothetical protein